MNYWIIVDSKPAGPYEGKQLVEAGLKPDTLVWRQGYATWVEASRVPELRDMMMQRDSRPAYPPQPQPSSTAQPVEDSEISAPSESSEQPEEPKEQEEIIIVETPAVEEVIIEEEPQQPQPEPKAQEPQQAAQQQPQPQRPMTPDSGAQNMAPAITEPCPPAYIAWAVIVTVLCCTIVGVVALVYASMTKSAYYRGDLQKSRRYSEITQWLIIASIVCGTALAPFQMIFMSLIN